MGAPAVVTAPCAPSNGSPGATSADGVQLTRVAPMAASNVARALPFNRSGAALRFMTREPCSTGTTSMGPGWVISGQVSLCEGGTLKVQASAVNGGAL